MREQLTARTSISMTADQLRAIGQHSHAEYMSTSAWIRTAVQSCLEQCTFHDCTITELADALRIEDTETPHKAHSLIIRFWHALKG